VHSVTAVFKADDFSAYILLRYSVLLACTFVQVSRHSYRLCNENLQGGGRYTHQHIPTHRESSEIPARTEYGQYLKNRHRHERDIVISVGESLMTWLFSHGTLLARRDTLPTSHTKKGRKCTCNMTLWRHSVTLLQCKRSIAFCVLLGYMSLSTM
jgi:hypothetical protein